jgi:selenocysteine lyase/cysteine desulfurase
VGASPSSRDPVCDPSQHPNPLAAHYRRFRVAERVLLSGHSHQAWPDCAFEGQQQAWLDAAEHVDAKWPLAFERADAVRRGYARLLEDDEGRYALAENTHELLVRFLSALPLRERPRLVTTDGEFHTIRRQLDRLAEEGLEVVKLPSEPIGTLAERLAEATDARTAATLVSAVLFRNARIVPRLAELASRCEARDVPLVVDAYHALNVLPYSLREQGLETSYVVGAGYKYCQLGEGNGFLRLPAGSRLRPVITGWFAEFELLASDRKGDPVGYPEGGARFAGATYDPTSHYRAAAVFGFFDELDLTPARLRRVNQHQLRLLADGFDALDLDPRAIDRDRSVPLGELGGFLVLTSPHAAELCRGLAERGVSSDHRGSALRLGPAPYLSDRQLRDALAALREAVVTVAK